MSLPAGCKPGYWRLVQWGGVCYSSAVFSLTRRERLLVAMVLLLFLVGWSYQTWRGYAANTAAMPPHPQASEDTVEP